ncbi:MAG: penicillin acylase family protein [Rhodomicrobium sp.]
MKKRRLWQIVAGIMGLAALFISLLGLWFWYILADSVPVLEGQMHLSGLQFPVEIKRDKSGVPTITAGNRLDLARALGFLHGQERFFQMDTLRRSGAGELSGLLGDAAVPNDISHRVHRFRASAAALWAQLPGEHRKLLQVYSEGVNAGLSALSRKPFEYTLLRAEPAPWRPEDTLLTVYAMYFQLQDSNGWLQRRRAFAEKALGPSLANFLYPPGEPDDAALDGSILPEPAMPQTYITPAAGVPASAPPLPSGSNAFAVSAAKSKSGRAIVANDMHLPLRVPNIWYRARLQIRQAQELSLDLNGVTLPGSPLLVAGSNGKIAWGFTDANIATSDAIVLTPAGGDPRSYLTPEGPRLLSVTTERICPARSSCQDLKVEDSIWGPVVARNADGTRIVLRWAAHDTNAINFNGLFEFEGASTIREAFDAAHRAGLPQENLVAVDRDGHVGWTIMGQVPRRAGLDGLPHSWADGSRKWQGYLSPGEIPEILDPPDGLIWSANNRAVGGAALSLLGNGGYADAARARRIRDDLKAKDKFAETDLLSIQLDIHASELKPWQGILVELLKTHKDALSVSMLSEVKSWGEAAAIDSVGYRLVRSFEEEAIHLIYGGFGGAIKALAGSGAGKVTPPRAEWPSLRLLSARPNHLVPPPFKTWNEVMDALHDRLTKRVRDEAGGDLAKFTWGQRNHAGIHHPLAMAIPALGLLTDPPDVPLPGDTLVPRVASPGFGASERFVISPGHESEGIFEMPVGEAGNPLSPYFLAGQSGWLDGSASPFLPGAPRWTLVLLP